MVASVRCALLGAIVGLFALGCVWDQTALSVAPADLVLESFDVFNDGDALLLPVDLNGKRYLFLLDTGATATCYDSSLAEQLGQAQEQARFMTPTGERQVPLYRSPNATAGKLELHTNSPVACVDMKPCREVSGHAIYGVVGMDVLRRHIIRLDFERGKVEFLRAVGDQPGVEVDLQMGQGAPIVEIGCAGSRAKHPCLIDTGLSGMCSCDLDLDILQELEAKNAARKVGEGHAVTLDGDRREPIYQVQAVSLGGKEVVNNAYFGTAKHNLLGLSCWHRFIVTLDFPNKRMYLKDTAHTEEADARNQSGLHILRREARTIVEFVDRDSAGERYGVQAHDVLVKIDEMNADDLRLYTLRRLLAVPGKTVTLTLRRGEVEIVRQVTLSMDDGPIVKQ
jgi:hypothetical protein